MDKIVKRITVAVSEKFRSFGGGRNSSVDNNPISAALKDEPSQFAAGVNIKEVVRFVLEEAKK